MISKLINNLQQNSTILSKLTLISYLSFLISFFLALAEAEKLKVFNFFGDGIYVQKPEIDDFATVSIDPNGNLPSSFTVCSSLFLAQKIHHYHSGLFFLLTSTREDGVPFFYTFDMSSETKQWHSTGHIANGAYKYGHTEFKPLIFNIWYHHCAGIDTVSGHVTSVLQGHLMYDQIIKEIKNSTELKPKSLKENLIIGKSSVDGKTWVEAHLKTSNVNVYSKKLSVEDMQEITNGSRCGEDGDYLAWSKSQWTIKGNKTKVEEIEQTELCMMKQSARYIHRLQNNEELMRTCSKLGKSKLHIPDNQEHSAEVADFFKKTALEKVDGEWTTFPNECPGYMLAAKDITEEDLDDGWINQNTNQPMEYFEWIPGQPNSKNQQCVTYQPTLKHGPGEHWWDHACEENYCGVCENELRPNFQLRGLCKESKLSILYTPNNDGVKGYLGYTGFSTCYITYNNSNFEWHLKKFGDDADFTWATSSATKETALLGTHDWIVHNDSKACSTDLDFITKLALTACTDTEFTCNDGICIDMNNRCDGRTDCNDKSDEIGCKIVAAEDAYNKAMNPSPKNRSEKAEISLSVKIKSILRIDEIDQSFHVSYKLTSKWKDPRLTYHNLKKNANLNVLTEQEQSSIWTPTIILVNTKATEAVGQDKRSLTRVIANENYTYSIADVTNLQNIFIFDGQENDIEMTRAVETDFICKYNMAMYPFDTQTCTMNFVLTEDSDDFCYLKVGGLSYLGPTELTQYFIKDKYMTKNIIDEQKGIKVYFFLGRRLLSNTLTVYLPTILLNTIGHLTVYFKPYFFEVRNQNYI